MRECVKLVTAPAKSATTPVCTRNTEFNNTITINKSATTPATNRTYSKEAWPLHAKNALRPRAKHARAPPGQPAARLPEKNFFKRFNRLEGTENALHDAARPIAPSSTQNVVLQNKGDERDEAYDCHYENQVLDCRLPFSCKPSKTNHADYLATFEKKPCEKPCEKPSTKKHYTKIRKTFQENLQRTRFNEHGSKNTVQRHRSTDYSRAADDHQRKPLARLENEEAHQNH